MNKFILALALGLAPFFSQSSIWTDGTVDLKNIKQTIGTEYVCFAGALTSGSKTIEGTYSQDSTDDLRSLSATCDDWASQYLETPDNACDVQPDEFSYTSETSSSRVARREYSIFTFACTINKAAHSFIFSARVIGQTDVKSCPPDAFPSYISGYDSNDDGEADKCFNPNQVNQVDDCRAGSDYSMLQNRVSVPKGCFTTPNGSQCMYNAVDVGGGVQAYQMDTEGDCYSDPQPDIVGENQQLPTGQECSEWGDTGMVCGEAPSDVCSADGTSCQAGCGTMNGQTYCVDNDTDSDSIPDYLDPDIDGDGIPNDDDLDADGNGQDDPIDNTGNGDGQSSSDGQIDYSQMPVTDMGPTVAKLEEIRKSVSKTSLKRNKEPTEGLTGFYESEYEDGLDGMFSEQLEEYKTTEFYTFLNNFKPSFGGTAPNFGFCFNFGANMNLGCFNLELDTRIFPALKIFILITAAFTCRKIIFGG